MVRGWGHGALMVRCAGACAVRCSPGLRKEQLGFLHLVVHDSPQLLVPATLFSSLQFLCVLLLEETSVQVRALQHRVGAAGSISSRGARKLAPDRARLNPAVLTLDTLLNPAVQTSPQGDGARVPG